MTAFNPAIFFGPATWLAAVLSCGLHSYAAQGLIQLDQDSMTLNQGMVISTNSAVNKNLLPLDASHTLPGARVVDVRRLGTSTAGENLSGNQKASVVAQTNDAIKQAGPASVTTTPTKDLRLPGLLINLEQRSVDIDASVCLREGTLELVACTKGTKEHESILVIDAKPMHVHAALLLLGAKPGNPAMRKLVGDKKDRWIDVPPRGGPVDVYLVFDDKGKRIEQPISDFIVSSQFQADGPGEEGREDKFPTHTFLFTGSILHKSGSGPGKYLCDESGNLISLVTFGDEVLGLPEVHSSENGALMWQVDAGDLPAVGSNVTLRLRPKIQSLAPTNQVGPRNPDSSHPKTGH